MREPMGNIMIETTHLEMANPDANGVRISTGHSSTGYSVVMYEYSNGNPPILLICDSQNKPVMEIELPLK
jgi:hypothetical protein